MTPLHAHIPYSRLAAHQEYLISNRISPEIYFTANDLEKLDKLSESPLSSQAAAFGSAGMPVSIHAPFMDLNPGSCDFEIRNITAKRILQTFQAAAVLKPVTIVCHPGYDDLRYGSDRETWLANSIDFWQAFLPLADHLECIIALENVFEKEPNLLRSLLDAINHNRFRYCLDIGHWNMFTLTTLEEWFDVLGPYIAECHLHDNHGQADEHLPPGEGVIDFTLLFSLLKRFAPQALWTIEAHSVERLQRALASIAPQIQSSSVT